MNKVKKHILSSIIATIMLVITISGVAYAFSGACYVEYGSSWFHNSIKASFYGNRMTNGSWGSIPYQHIRRSWAKIVEGGQTVKDYSERATSTSDGTLRYAYAWKADDWRYTAHSSYSWCEYF